MPEPLNTRVLTLTPRGILICTDFPLWICTLHYVKVVIYKNEWHSLGGKPFVYGSFLVMVQ